MDAQEHDSYVAGISHLPLVVSTALFSLARDSAAWPELSQLASSGFRDTTRLASGSPDMSTDISVTNRENVVHWLDRFIQELMKYRDLISGEDEEALFKAFARIQFEGSHLLRPKQRARPGRSRRGESALRILVGQWAISSQREIMKALEEKRRRRRAVARAESLERSPHRN
jgi:prephenate dehydrogenase